MSTEIAAGTDVREHRILYGCMGLGGGWDTEPYTAADVDTAEAAVRAALDAGITAFDHADIYKHGKAEAVFGELLARDPQLRGRITLQTKCGIRVPARGRVGLYDLRADTIRQRVAESLERLRTDHVDVLLLHRPDPLMEPAQIAAAFADLHRQGLVRQFGVSNMDASTIGFLRAQVSVPLVVNQVELSLARRELVESPGTLEHCRAHGIGVQAWGPLARGRYTGAGPDDETTRLVAELAERKGTTPETIVLWWLRRHPARIAPVIGTARPERIRACRDAANAEPDLSHDEWYQLWISARGAALP
ncbi:aldo/keto reductase [Hamadaea tsunoensis]|uniref:aldo/keto reductase n=1 Tax=Hamadaea tsunoensis TaxID=53368 RepID=UPI0003FAFFC4|nr:aldo/keto reductase [Hamadaea tsunoensis]